MAHLFVLYQIPKSQSPLIKPYVKFLEATTLPGITIITICDYILPNSNFSILLSITWIDNLKCPAQIVGQQV